MLDFEDIDLSNDDEVGAQITERRAAIDRLQGEVQQLKIALINSYNCRWAASQRRR